MSVSKPLPYSERRKGLPYVSMQGDFLLRLVDRIADGVPLDQVRTFISAERPENSDSTHQVQFGVFRNDLRIFEVLQDRVVLTEVGAELRRTRDHSVFAPRLLTDFVGVDVVIDALRSGSLTRKDLTLRLQAAHPGWTSGFGPSQLLSWLTVLGAIEVSEGRRLRLTASGSEKWLSLITWPLESAPMVAAPPKRNGEGRDESDSPRRWFTLPTFTEVWTRLEQHPTLTFKRDRVAALHAGLWANDHRHFAVFAGLSGSGKTALAVAYGEALVQEDGGPEGNRVRVIPVSPGWSDATPLLGYAVPLSADEEYEVPAFLQVLLEAAENPDHIYVAVLDEMNLSHPEQYLAPVLSAMELPNQPLVIHNREAMYSNVPSQLGRYPTNLVIIGTVNMDETTHGLSDKVLDRATTLEFWELDFDFAPSGRTPKNWQTTRDLLQTLYTLLEPHRLHFGRRVVDDVVAFLRQAESDGELGDAALDWALYGKVLPKLRGHDTPQLRSDFEKVQKLFEESGLKKCAGKVQELLADLRSSGSARFWR